jgi:hypothetical protein
MKWNSYNVLRPNKNNNHAEQQPHHKRPALPPAAGAVERTKAFDLDYVECVVPNYCVPVRRSSIQDYHVEPARLRRSF